jgi:hypothetical protein
MARPGARRDPRVDRYVAAARPFARPVLRHLRAVVHAGCPGVAETIKWGMPAFEHHGLLCFMAAFTAHAAFGFHRGEALAGVEVNREAMGHFGRLTAVADLPPRAALVRLVRRAAAVNEAVAAARAAARATRGPRPGARRRAAAPRRR